VAGIAYILQTLAYPVHEGRDFATYALYYRDLFQSIPEYPVLMLFRTPVTPILFGILFDTGSGLLLQFYFFVSYLTFVLLLFRIASFWGTWAGWLVILFTVLSVQFFNLFNSVASENPASLFSAIWLLWAFRHRKSNTFIPWVILALIGICLVLVRPNFQILGLGAILPLIMVNAAFWRRIVLSATYAAVFISGIAIYSSYNWIRYDAFEVAHLGPAHMPYFRVFNNLRIVRATNGPASEELAELIRKDVLTRSQFTEYGITEELFFEAGSMRFWIHTVDALNHEFGHLDNNRLLKKVAWEACSANPILFWLSYIDSLRSFYEFPERSKLAPDYPGQESYESLLAAHRIKCLQKGLEIPSESDFIEGGLSQLTFQPNGWEPTPDARSVVWDIPNFNSVHLLSRLLYLGSFFRPSIFLFFLLGCWFFISPSRNKRDFIYLCVSIGVFVAMLCATCIGNPNIFYRYPFDPIFSILGAIAIPGLVHQTRTLIRSVNFWSIFR